jgi:hypothetical protein
VIAALLLAGAALVAAGGAVAAGPRTLRHGLVVQAVGAAALAVGGFAALLQDATLGAAFTSALDPRLGVDALTGFFLGTLGLVAAPALVFSTRYLEPTARGRVTGALTAKITPPATAGQIGRFLEQSIPVFRSLRGGLKRLSPPKALRALHLRALELERQQIDGIQDLIDAIDGGADPRKAFNALDARLAKVGKAEGATWQKLRIPACGDL